MRYSRNAATVASGSQSPVASNAFCPASTSIQEIFLPCLATAASITRCAAGQMSTPVPSPSMNGMIGSSGTERTPEASWVIFSGIVILLSAERGRDRRSAGQAVSATTSRVAANRIAITPAMSHSVAPAKGFGRSGPNSAVMPHDGHRSSGSFGSAHNGHGPGIAPAVTTLPLSACGRAAPAPLAERRPGAPEWTPRSPVPRVALGDVDQVAEQHRDRRRADAPDARGDRAGNLLARLVDVGQQRPALVPHA